MQDSSVMRRAAFVVFVSLLGTSCNSGSRAMRSDYPPTDTAVAQRIALIGQLEGAQEYLLGDVTAVAGDSGGVIYIADRIGSSVRAFDSKGSYLGTVGSEGQGPGEFQWPNDITFDEDGRMYVRDATSLSVFALRSGAAFADSLVRTISLGRYSLESTRGKAVGSQYYYPSYLFRNFLKQRYFYLVFDSMGATGDTLSIPPLRNAEFLGRANYPVNPEVGRPVPGINHAPFEAMPSWDVTPEGTLVTVSGDRYEIVELGTSGDTLRIVGVHTEPRGVPESWAHDSGQAWRARLDSVPVPLDRVRGMSDVARDRRLPEVLPEVISVQVDATGRFWVERWPAPHQGGQTVFDVFDRSGTLLRTVRMSADFLADPPPFVSADLVVGVLRDPDSGVERVAVFRILDMEVRPDTT